MKSVDVVRAVFFDHGDDRLPHSGQNRSDDNRRHHADDDAENRQKRAKFIRANAVERHLQNFNTAKILIRQILSLIFSLAFRQRDNRVELGALSKPDKVRRRRR
jgi:hypothetical protein